MKLLLVLAMSTIVSGSVYAECKVESPGDCSSEKTCNDLNGAAKTKVVMWKDAKCVKIAAEAVTDCSGVLNTAPGAKGSTGGTDGKGSDAAGAKDK